MYETQIAPLDPDRFEAILDPARYASFRDAARRTADLLRGSKVWHLNTASVGGGVAEMLRSLLGYTVGSDVETGWLVLEGGDEFFRITKRVHNLLHGQAGDGGELGTGERTTLERVLASEAQHLTTLVRPSDVVVVHDPQPAGLIPVLKQRGVKVIWRCHVGIDGPNELARAAWAFLLPYVAQADAVVFSRREYAWEGLDEARLWVIAPSIDAFSSKNQPMTEEAAAGILQTAEILYGDGSGGPTFMGADGARATVSRKARMIQQGPLPADVPIVVQVSRWDRLKDPEGVLSAFAAHVAERFNAHLVLAGPETRSVSDDPEDQMVLEACIEAWRACPPRARDRIHLACLPMEDLEENGAIVNALQRRADIVVQKSLAEGFGLTVAEAMWKGRPVVASRVGGIKDQIEHTRSGLLVDPTDHQEFGRALSGLLEDGDGAARMGREAHRRVLDEFLDPRHLVQFGQVLQGILDAPGQDRRARPPET
jgi:trehalose synthase